MIFFTWKDDYLIHHSEIDLQHQKLVSLINELYADLLVAQNNEQKRQAIQKLLEELVDYSYYHFDTEEKLMVQLEYPCYIQHVKQHMQFKEQVAQFMQVQSEDAKVMPFPIVVFLKDWLTSHILQMDKQLGTYLQTKQ